MLEDLILQIRSRGRRGQPLFAYQATDDEIQKLRDGLQHVFLLRSDLKRHEMAAFCLFAAEWFRRHYRAGPWTWDTILADGLQLQGHRLQQIRQQYVRTYTEGGVAEWGLELISLEFGTRYLGTLVCHGGLPLVVLESNHAALTGFLRSLLEQQDRFPHISKLELAADQEWRLPLTLRNSVVREWAVKVVEAVVQLRQLLAIAGAAAVDPIAALEQHVPDWRNKLPFAVTDDTARTLLVALLQTPAVDAEPADQLQIRTFLWIPPTGNVQVIRRIDGSDRLSEDFIARLFGIEISKLPSRFQLFLSTTGGSIHVATPNRVFGEKSYRANVDSTRSMSGPAVTGHVMVSAAVGQIAVGIPRDLSGGSALPDSPWVFRDEDCRLLGTGRVRTCRSTVLVAISDDWTLRSLDGPPPEMLRPCADLARTTYRISGSVIALPPDEGESFRITTGAEADDIPSFELRGNRCLLGTAGCEAWLGVPSVYRSDTPNGPWTQVAPQNVH